MSGVILSQKLRVHKENGKKSYPIVAMGGTARIRGQGLAIEINAVLRNRLRHSDKYTENDWYTLYKGTQVGCTSEEQRHDCHTKISLYYKTQ